MRAIIFTNGEFRDVQRARELMHVDTLVIAANGGTRHVLATGVTPDVIIGDMDSLSTEVRTRIETAGTQTIPFSPDKDQTDLELALLHAARVGATEIVILGALGGRLDQMLANILLLALPTIQDIDVRIVDGVQEAFLIQDEANIVGQLGDTVSLMPLGGDAAGVTTAGLKWPLIQETLYFGPARGVSNVLVEKKARIKVERGSLLCIVIHTTE